MPDIIKLLPDAVANQIAAGEVIQRPASVVKELVENAIDAEAKSIKVLIKEAGRTSIQIIDDGKGMSETDARMAFERHATSKISRAEDLFSIQTKGFRGEALASIAAVAQVELKSCTENSEVGTRIQINGSSFECQEAVACSKGSTFTVSNLFYNIPARRKFLKANTTEFRHIVNEFTRIALVSPAVKMMLIHNGEILYDLPAGNLKSRISGLIGKVASSRIFDIEVDTPIVKLKGYIGKPDFARKRSGEQYFFANNRFMRHPYFHRAIMDAYSNLLPPDTIPSYFIYFTVNPDELDVNIHPTKTEIKFENEQAIWPILMASVKEALGKFNVVPSIDFDQEGSLDFPVSNQNTTLKAPSVHVDHSFNPFNPQQGFETSSKPSIKGWEDFYSAGKEELPSTVEMASKIGGVTENATPESFFNGEDLVSDQFFQVKNRYILTNVKSGLMMIDQRRAHIRILFERYLKNLETRKGLSQKLLFPEILNLDQDDKHLVDEIAHELRALGFDLQKTSGDEIEVHAIPGDLLVSNAATDVLQSIVSIAKNNKEMIKSVLHEKMAASLAEYSAIGYGKSMNNHEMQDVVDQLFACHMPSYTPDGKIVVSILSNEDLIQRFS